MSKRKDWVTKYIHWYLGFILTTIFVLFTSPKTWVKEKGWIIPKW